MPKLIIENGPDRGKSYFITAEGPFFIGRDKAAQVPLQDEMTSRRHCQVEVQNGSFHIRDLGSSNGTLLNGRAVKGVQPLTSNDRIQVGDTSITFIDENKPSLVGQEISGYRILDRIGRGGMGTVYRALQTSLDREVALKILAPHLTSNASFVNLFIREARAAGALSHPNIVQVYDVGVHQETYFFSMEFIPNGSVEDILNLGGALPLPRALRIVRDAAQGLEYAEHKGIIHRDIKPGNLMVGANGVIKIGDLGIARSTEGEGSISQKDGVSGSPHYIAPEQARGHDIDHRVDIYSLGVSFYQMLCGKTPFSGATPREVILKHLRDEPPRLKDRVADLPDEVARMVDRMMAKQPDQRPLSATALLEELRPLLQRFPEDETAIAVVPRARRLLPYWLLAGAVLLAAGIFGAVQWQRHRTQEASARARVIATCADALAKIEGAIDGGNLQEARASLDGLPEAEILLEEQRATRMRLEEKWRERDDRRRLAERSRLADEELEAAKTTAADLAALRPEIGVVERAPAAIAQLEKVAADHAEFEAVRAEALKLLAALRSQVQEIARRRRDLERAVEAAVKNASEHARNRYYDLAYDELMGVPADARGASLDPELGREWQDAMNALAGKVNADWEEIERSVQQRVNDRAYFDAKAALAAFDRRVGDFPEIKAAIEGLTARIIEIERSQATAPAPGEDSRTLLRNLMRGALGLLAKDVSLSGSDLTRDILTARRAGSLQGADLAALEKLEVHLKAWPAVFQDLVAKQPGRGAIVTLAIEGSAQSVEITRFDRDKLYYREVGAIPESFRRWDEIAAPECAQVLGLCARTDKHRLYVGLVAYAAGAAEQSDKLWRGIAAGAAEARELTELRVLLALLEETRGGAGSE
ncbi:MAG: protein kinase [Planctomycetes bacterium]|nr:protein kinase [Planctomycetota bacterium]